MTPTSLAARRFKPDSANSPWKRATELNCMGILHAHDGASNASQHRAGLLSIIVLLVHDDIIANPQPAPREGGTNRWPTGGAIEDTRDEPRRLQRPPLLTGLIRYVLNYSVISHFCERCPAHATWRHSSCGLQMAEMTLPNPCGSHRFRGESRDCSGLPSMFHVLFAAPYRTPSQHYVEVEHGR